MRRARRSTGRVEPAAKKAGAAGDGVLLAWALDRDGARAFVGALDPAARRARGPFRCLGCGEELVARLGARRARHFAHRPGSVCALTRPETILHLNAKERLLALCAAAFSGETAVRLLARCARCRRETPLALASFGDAAVAEGAAGALRCDVLVSRGGAPSLALEVKVSHAVDAAKERSLAELGIPALEIDAREEWERAEAAGAAVIPARTLGLPPCGACQAAARADAGRAEGGEAAEVAELEAYRARGLLGPPPGPALDDLAELSAADRRALRFRCPECGGRELSAGGRLARHACPGRAPRPVAWRGYDGAVVALAWWRR